MRFDTISEINAYFEGVKHGIWCYAWWKDGTQYVGTCGRTLAAAEADMEKQKSEALWNLEHGREVFTG